MKNVLLKIGIAAALLILPVVSFGQTGPIQGYCTQGASSAVTSGLISTNKLQGVVPQCTVTVYLTGTITKATITSDGTTSLTNPFMANTSGYWLFYVASNEGYDVTLSGGFPPQQYASPQTYVDLFPGAASSGVGTITGVTASTGLTGGGTSGNVTLGCLLSTSTQFGCAKPDGTTITATGGVLTAASTVVLQHGGANLTDQSLLNFVDTPASLSGGSLDAGYQPIKFKSDAVGGLAAETLTPLVASGIQNLVVPPSNAQFVIIYPTNVTTAQTNSTITVANDTSASIQTTPYCTFGGTGTATWTFTGALAAQAPWVVPANVTTAFAFAISSNLQTLGGSGNCLGVPFASSFAAATLGVTGSGITATALQGSNTWNLQQFTNQLLGATGTNLGTVQFQAQSTMSVPILAGGSYNIPLVGIIVYYTGTAPPVLTALNVKSPLNYNSTTNTLGIDSSAVFQSNILLSLPVVAALPIPSTTPGALATVRDGTSSTDCTTGGGSSISTCRSNGSAWVAFSGSGGTISLTTSGTSGAATLTGSTLNIPQYQGAVTLSTTGSSGAATFSGGALNIPQYQGSLTLTTSGTSGNATLSGTTLNIPNYSGGVGGVSSLNSQTGAVTVTGDSTLSVTTTTGNLALHVIGTGGSSVQYNPSNTQYLWIGDSHLVTNQQTGPTASAASCVGNTCTITATQSFVAGQDIWFADAFAPSCLGGQVWTVLSSGLSGSSFQVTARNCTTTSGAGGSLADASLNLPEVTQNQPFFAGHGTTINMGVDGQTTAQEVTNYTALYHSTISACVTSGAKCFVFVYGGVSNDIGAGTSPATIEGSINSLYGLIHADGATVVGIVGTNGAFNNIFNGQNGIAQFSVINDWIMTQYTKNVSPTTNGYDLLVNLFNALNDPYSTNFSSDNVHYTPGGTAVGAFTVNQAMASQASAAQGNAKSTGGWNVWTGFDEEYDSGTGQGLLRGMLDQGSANTTYPYQSWGTNSNAANYMMSWHFVSSGLYQEVFVPGSMRCWNVGGAGSGPVNNGGDTGLSRDGSVAKQVDVGDCAAQGNTNGGFGLTYLIGPGSAPSGSCSGSGLSGRMELTQDGAVTWCNPANTTWTTVIKGSTNCLNGASPAVCGSALNGAVALPTGTGSTLVVGTNAVTANSEISLQVDDTVNISGTTCNSTLATLVGTPLVITARTAGVSFTVSTSASAVITTNPLCFTYQIKN